MHHHVVVQHDSFLVQVEELIDDYLRLHDANVLRTKLKKEKGSKNIFKLFHTSFSVIANVCICKTRFLIKSISVEDDEGDNDVVLVVLRR